MRRKKVNKHARGHSRSRYRAPTAHRTLGVSLGRSAPTARHGDQRDAARRAPLPTAASAGEWGTHATTKLGPQGPSFMWAMHGHSSGSPS